MNLNEREKALEDLYAHDQETHFKIRSYRNKLAGQWAATKLNTEASKYAETLVTAFLTRQQLFDRLKADFAKAGTVVADSEIAAKIIEFTEVSRKHFMN
jgi:hypothetical protein